VRRFDVRQIVDLFDRLQANGDTTKTNLIVSLTGDERSDR
jgi:hypothetical protein